MSRLYTPRMDFTGQVFFKFGCKDAWLFYQFVRRLAETGAKVSLEWTPIPTPDTVLPVSVYGHIPDADDRGRFFHALFGLTFLEDMEAGSQAAVTRALAEAALGDVNVESDPDMIESVTAQGEQLGVTSSPSLYRHGPVTAITLTPAVLTDDPIATAEAILTVADNDGIWELRKP